MLGIYPRPYGHLYDNVFGGWHVAQSPSVGPSTDDPSLAALHRIACKLAAHTTDNVVEGGNEAIETYVRVKDAHLEAIDLCVDHARKLAAAEKEILEMRLANAKLRRAAQIAEEVREDD